MAPTLADISVIQEVESVIMLLVQQRGDFVKGYSFRYGAAPLIYEIRRRFIKSV